MLELKIAKSMMENEKGMNHLWIQILRLEKLESQKCEIQIRLPNGIYRSHNLNGYVENERDHIIVEAFDREVIIEIYTQDAIECGQMTIAITLFSCETTISKEIPIQIVEDDEMDMVQIDELVVERIKEISNANIPSKSEIDFIQPRVLEKTDSEFSYLEKKYRIDY